MDDWFKAMDETMPRGWSPDTEAKAAFSRWAQPTEIQDEKWRWPPGSASILLGRVGENYIARPDDDRHIITCAGTRAGKGRSLILPNLMTWPGSVIVIDPKGELARKTARWRSEGLKQSVVVLDPFGVSGWPTASYNPLDDIDPRSDTALDDIALVAEALITDAVGSDRHWTDSAKNLVRLILAYMLCHGEDPSLTRLRSVLLGKEGSLVREEGQPSADNLFKRMTGSGGFDGYVSLVGETFFEKSERELSSILSVAREQLAFLDSQRMPRVLASSGFELSSIKGHPTTVYMCLPAGRLATHFRWLRTIVNMALAKLEDSGTHQKTFPVLLLLEEFATLGHMDAIEKAAGQIAGFGVKLWPILQDLGQLKAIYKDRWQTFLGNAGVTTWFGLNDLFSLEYVSKRLGDTHFVRREKNDLTMGQRAQGASEFRESVVNSPLLTPEEVGRIFARETNRMLVLHPGSRPMIIERIDAAVFGEKIDDE